MPPEPLPQDLLNLPAIPGDGEVEELVFDGEVVEEDRAPGAPPPSPVRAVIVLRPVVVVVRVVVVVVRHERTKAVARHAGYVPAGLVVAARRRQRGRTLTAEMAHLAAARGDLDKAVEWARQDHEQRERRAERHRSAWEAAGHFLHPQTLKGVAIAVAVVVVLLAMTGWMRYLVGLYHLVSVVAAFAWDVRYGVPAAVLLWLWHLGRTAGSLAPKWARTSADSDVDVTIDELTITQALANLRIPQIKDYLKRGAPLQFTVGCRQEGRGTYAEVRLPGVPAEKVVRRRPDVAAGVHRLAKEVWPSTGSEAAILKLWIADKGALEEGAGPYPLLEEGFTDVFKGLPFGKILRGDPARIPVIGRNTIAGGMPEQGKSNAGRVVACGYTLDIATEIRIYVPDTNFDFEHFAPRCSSYVMGAEDEYIEQILGEMESLKDELQARGQLLVDHEVQEVTREIAHAGVGLHPVFVLLEEAHVAIQHRKFGKDVSQLLCDIVKLDRKRGVHLMVSTQAPTKDNMPRDVTRNCANGIAFAVGDHVANDGLLGQGAYRAGHRATELIPGTDRGTALCKGFSGERSEMVQVHRIQASSDNDQVTPLVNRALAAMAEQGRAVPGTGRGPLAIVSRDLLADVAQVLAGSDRKARLADLPGMLHRLAPSWGPYKSLTGKGLKQLLDDEQVRTTNTGNVRELDPADLRRAIGERERTDA